MIQSCLERERPERFVETSQTRDVTAETFVEPVVPRPLLLIAGGGHVGQALAVQGLQIGFDVTVVDDRPEFTDPALFPRGVETCCGLIPEQLSSRSAGCQTPTW